MGILIRYGIDCPHCDDDQFAVCTALDLTNPQPDGSIRIDIEMIGQTRLECPGCGCEFFIGDIEPFDDRGGECSSDTLDDEDEEDDDHV